MQNFNKSHAGAESAWRGFSSQTLYIAFRFITGADDYEYYPENIEDLVIKNKGRIIEAVQVKNVTDNLNISALAAPKTSAGGEGFFKRMCSLYEKDKLFNRITVVCFGGLGEELQKVSIKDSRTIQAVSQKLIKDHKLTQEEAFWLLNSISFVKVNIETLESEIIKQFCKNTSTEVAVDLFKNRLIQYISSLSLIGGYTTKQLWNEEVHKIRRSISALDGYYKEYGKSLVRLDELKLNKNEQQLREEYSQGISAHPSHIRMGLDFERSYWMERIHELLVNHRIAVIKGVSGQGKTTLCYRYLINNYPDTNVFCVNSITTNEQALSLTVAIAGLCTYSKNNIVYIDAKPGDKNWILLIQEMQIRGIQVPILVSIRDEDYNTTSINGKDVTLKIIELTLQKDEAQNIYESMTKDHPHGQYRSFEDSWNAFRNGGPFIEYTYMLTNNQSMKERIEMQISSLISEGIDDKWIELILVVSYAGRLDCPIRFQKVKSLLDCHNMYAAIKRLKDEYLIRQLDDNTIETLHPVRAQFIIDALSKEITLDTLSIAVNASACVSSDHIKLVLLDYFSNHAYNTNDVIRFSQIDFELYLVFRYGERTRYYNGYSFATAYCF